MSRVALVAYTEESFLQVDSYCVWGWNRTRISSPLSSRCIQGVWHIVSTTFAPAHTLDALASMDWQCYHWSETGHEAFVVL